MKKQWMQIAVAAALALSAAAQETGSTAKTVRAGSGFGTALPAEGQASFQQRLNAVAQNGLPGSQASFQQRLNSIVGRAAAAPGQPQGSIITFSPLTQKQTEELTEDLNVLSFIINRSLERALGSKETEYRLGVPMLLNNDSRLVQASYLQDYGVIVRMHVPFPVAAAGEPEKKSDTSAPAATTEWEKARRAIYGGDDDAQATPGQEPLRYDDKLVSSLKHELFDTLKNGANVRNLKADEWITVVVLGGANVSTRPVGMPGGAEDRSNLNKNTILTIRVKKSDADAVATGSRTAEQLASSAQVSAYFDNTPAAGRTVMSGSMGGYGVGWGGYPPAAAGR